MRRRILPILILAAAAAYAAGEAPKIEYNSEFETAYDVTKPVAKPESGKAGIEAFFTAKDNAVFATLPRWRGRRFHINDVTGIKSVTLLGSASPLKFKAANGGVSVELPDLPEELLAQSAWVLKLSR
jgi:alpha-L-fucosidase